MGKRWFEIIFCAKWNKQWVEKEYEIDRVFTQAENQQQAKKWFEEFKKMFEYENPAEILTYEINGGLPVI